MASGYRYRIWAPRLIEKSLAPSRERLTSDFGSCKPNLRACVSFDDDETFLTTDCSGRAVVDGLRIYTYRTDHIRILRGIRIAM